MLRSRRYWRLAIAAAAMAAALASCEVGLASGHGPAPQAEEDDEAFADAKVRGVELGEYRIRAYYPVEAQKSTVRFILYASVPSERFAETRQLAEDRRHKVRDEIITATRMSPLAIFDEADLASFRRRILLRLRRTVPELVIDDVYVSDFSLTVKSL